MARGGVVALGEQAWQPNFDLRTHDRRKTACKVVLQPLYVYHGTHCHTQTH